MTVQVTPADLAICRQMLKEGSKSFYLASLLLPERVRSAARQLYAFCRLSDDLVDQHTHPRDSVAQLQMRLDAIYAGTPWDAGPDRAMADVVERFAIPKALPEALLEGFAWDADERQYQTLSEVRAYAVRVAGTVGAMMSLIMGCRSPEALARAIDLGIAMQLTNIARDVGEDARNGRLYIPRDWVGADDLLSDPTHSQISADCVLRILDEAGRFYQLALPGIGLLPRRCQPAIHAARLLYSEIGGVIAEHGHDSMSRRAVVSKARKLQLMSSAFFASSTGDASLPPCAEGAFLVQAVMEHSGQPEHVPQGLDERAAWVIDLFLKLQRRQR
jgi:15-cis-phytoene synthase